jgi:hypothetical protein
MIKVTPYMLTLGTEKFKNFLSQPFNFELLYNIDDNKQIYFDCWRVKNIINWVRYTNDDDVILEVYPDYFNIKKNKIDVMNGLPHPLTINDFINDLTRFNIQLYWNIWIDENFEPKDYLHKDEIKKYYINLLYKIDKSFELLK